MENKKDIYVVVAVDSNGNWHASGAHDFSIKETVEDISGEFYADYIRVYVLRATIALPSVENVVLKHVQSWIEEL